VTYDEISWELSDWRGILARSFLSWGLFVWGWLMEV